MTRRKAGTVSPRRGFLRTLTGVVASGTAGLVVAACRGGKPGALERDDAGRTRLRVQLNWVPEPEFGGLYAALEGNLYARRGLAVELIKGSAGVPSAQLVASGKVELAVVSGPEIVQLRARGAPIVGIYAQFLRSPRAIVVHADSPYTTLEALWRSDSRVIVEPGQSFARWLDHRWSGNRLERVPSTGSLAAFLGDPTVAQAVYVFAEPVELARRGVETRSFDVADSEFDPYEAVIATNDAFAGAHPDLLREFVTATREGWEAYLADPGPTNAVMAELNPAMSREAMDAAAERIAPYVRPEGSTPGVMTTERWDGLVEQLATIGAIERGSAPSSSSLWREDLAR